MKTEIINALLVGAASALFLLWAGDLIYRKTRHWLIDRSFRGLGAEAACYSIHESERGIVPGGEPYEHSLTEADYH